MLHRKEYKAIAEIVKNCPKKENCLEIPYFMKALCDFLKQDNPQFDIDKFVKATGLYKN